MLQQKKELPQLTAVPWNVDSSEKVLLESFGKADT
jgi:hypothetical protein